VGLLLPSLASLAFWLRFLRYLAIPFAGLGVLVGGLGFLATLDDRKPRDTVWLSLGGGVSLLVLLTALFWPSVLHRYWGMDFTVDEPDPNHFLVVTVHNQQVVKDLGRSEWVDAESQSLRQGDVHVRIVSVRLGVPPQKKEVQKKEAKGKAPPPGLLIQVAVVNVGQLRLIPYQGLGKAEPPPVLSDDQGRSYPLHPFPPAAGVLDQVERAVLGPAREVNDLLVFEAPPAEAGALKLEFPASAWGGTGTCRFRISRGMIIPAPPRGQVRPEKG
jgi:hypothetical protein